MVGFLVYDDFDAYTTGQYEVTIGAVVDGAHAVKIIGWGYDSGNNNRLYWICQNQWGTSWGNAGFFNIYENEAGLDVTVYGCDPQI